MLRPASGCSTFGVSDRMRVPAPAARTMTADAVFVVTALPRPRGRLKARRRRLLAKARSVPTVARQGSLGAHGCSPRLARCPRLLAKARSVHGCSPRLAPSPGLEPELSEPKSEV